MNVTEPTAEQCSANALICEDEHEIAYALWYPQMGGYLGKAVAVIGKSDISCIDVFVWHNGEFPFGGQETPRKIHHCDPAQFIDFGQNLQAMQQKFA